jgi:hypothetical protein
MMSVAREPDPLPAERRRIECVEERPDEEPYRRIGAVGGAEASLGWRMSEEEAIAAIGENRVAFYVIVGGSVARVVVAEHRGHTYLKTDADERDPNHLLALADCPPADRKDG